jgi:hypothetical protein
MLKAAPFIVLALVVLVVGAVIADTTPAHMSPGNSVQPAG